MNSIVLGSKDRILRKSTPTQLLQAWMYKSFYPRFE